MNIKAIPDGYHSVTPYLSVDGAAKAIEFYIQAFGAEESFRHMSPSGEIGHAEVRIGGFLIMLADACEDGAFRNPSSLGGSSVGLHVYVEDVDDLFSKAVEAGATVISPVQDQFYGDRTGTLRDPFGHIWFFATHKEDISPEELGRRAEALANQGDTK